MPLLLTWPAASTLAKALRLLEVEEEEVLRKEEYPQKRSICVPVACEQQCLVLDFVLGFKLQGSLPCVPRWEKRGEIDERHSQSHVK